MVLHSTPFRTSNPFGGNQSSPFGTNSGSQGKKGKQPRYVATRNEDWGLVHSISAMPAYLDKSHEELRCQTYQQITNKGDRNTCPTPNIFNSPSIFKNSSHNTPFQSFTFTTPKTITINTSPTPSIFNSPSNFNPSSHNTPFQSFTSNPFTTPKTTAINTSPTPNTLTSHITPFQPFTSNPFSTPKTTTINTPPTPFSPFSQPSFPPHSSTPTVTQTPNPFSPFSKPQTSIPTVTQTPNPFSPFSKPQTSIPSTPTVTQTPTPFSSFSKLQPSIPSAPTVTQTPNPFSPFSKSQTSIPSTPTVTQTSNPFSPFSKPQTSIPSTPTVTQTPNPFSLTQFREPILSNTDQFPKTSTALTTPSVGLFSSQSTQCFSNQPSKSNPSTPNKTDNFITTTNNTISPSLNPFSHINSSSPTPVSSTTTPSPSVNPFSHINLYPSQSQPSIPQPTPSITPVDSWPFTPRTPQIGQNDGKVDSVSTNDQPLQASNRSISSSMVANTGISSLPVSNDLSTKRGTMSTSLLRLRHVATRQPWLPPQRPTSETKVPFFISEVDKPAPLLLRENPRAWIKNSFSLHSHSNTKGEEDATEKRNADILATMPKLPEGGSYYTEPCVTELVEKEIAEPGWCTRVKDFVVGRRGYGRIKLLEETDVRNLDLESVVLFNDREVIVYPDNEKKPPVGQKLNKPCEITLLNVKCMGKKAGKKNVEGPQVERYKEKLMRKCSEQGAEFVSYDPVKEEWKFRVQHF